MTENTKCTLIRNRNFFVYEMLKNLWYQFVVETFAALFYLYIKLCINFFKLFPARLTNLLPYVVRFFIVRLKLSNHYLRASFKIIIRVKFYFRIFVEHLKIGNILCKRTCIFTHVCDEHMGLGTPIANMVEPRNVKSAIF